jgi:hypothetical protein
MKERKYNMPGGLMENGMENLERFYLAQVAQMQLQIHH